MSPAACAAPCWRSARAAGGERPASDIVWKQEQGTPDTPCPVVWHDLLFTVTDDGIVARLRRPAGPFDRSAPAARQLQSLAAGGRGTHLLSQHRRAVHRAGRRPAWRKARRKPARRRHAGLAGRRRTPLVHPRPARPVLHRTIHRHGELMKRIVWLTDIHLNFLRDQRSRRFSGDVAAEHPDAVLIGGDIGESHDVCDYLEQIRRALDPRRSTSCWATTISIAARSRKPAAAWSTCVSRTPGLFYLSALDVEPLGEGVGLVGDDGWADGRLGDYARSLVVMQDWRLIAEFAGLDKRRRWEVLKALGDEAAEHMRRVLPLVVRALRRGLPADARAARGAKPVGTKARSPTMPGCRTSPARPSARRSSKRWPPVPASG